MKSSLIRLLHVKLEMTDMMLQWLQAETGGLYTSKKLDFPSHLCQDEKYFEKSGDANYPNNLCTIQPFIVRFNVLHYEFTSEVRPN